MKKYIVLIINALITFWILKGIFVLFDSNISSKDEMVGDFILILLIIIDLLIWFFFLKKKYLLSLSVLSLSVIIFLYILTETHIFYRDINPPSSKQNNLILPPLPQINKNLQSNAYEITPITYKLTGDFSSSGAERRYEAILALSKDYSISGYQTYYVGQGGGCTSNCDRTTKCIIENKKWVDSNTGSACNLNYKSSDGRFIMEEIKEGKIKSISECIHGDLCYEIIK